MLDKSNHIIEIFQENSPPTPEELENLGAGCYVQVKDGEDCYWVEIQAVENDLFSGVVHCELNDSYCRSDIVNENIALFNKQQIVGLGCDNYCWC